MSLVGYTNAGKTTLLNALSCRAGRGSGSGVLSDDMLFATLDPTTGGCGCQAAARFW